MQRGVFIGTSGWMYNHWKGNFYPEDIIDKKMLRYYSHKFKTVEINNTFYKLPKVKTVTNWYKNSSREFLFSVKANRYITHMKNLKDCKEPIKNFLERIKHLKKKLGPILFQLPPNWHKNQTRLEQFLEILPKNLLYVIELRHFSWFDEDIYELFKKYKICLCIHDITGTFTPIKLFTSFLYLRFHGPDGNYYKKYSK